MEKIKIFIKKNELILNKYSNNQILLFRSKFFKCKFFEITLIPEECDYEINHIFEISHLNLKIKNNVIIYLHFLPEDIEIEILSKYILNNNIPIVFSHFEKLNSILPRHNFIVWPYLKYSFKNDIIENEDDIWDNMFDFKLIDTLNKNNIYLSKKKNVYYKKNYPIIYSNEIFKKDTIIKQYRYQEQNSWDFFLEKIYNLLLNIFKKQDNIIFLPFLNVHTNSFRFIETKSKAISLISNNENYCFCSKNLLKKFNKECLYIDFNNEMKGIYINKNVLNTKKKYHKFYNNYYNLLFIDIEKYPYIINNYILNENIISDSFDNKYYALPPISEWKISNNSIYIKKPQKDINEGIIFFIDNIDYLNLIISNIKKIKNNYPIEIYYLETIDYLDLNIEKFTNKNIRFIKINSNILKSSHYLIEIQLFIFIQTQFQKCLWINENINIQGNVSILFKYLEKYDSLFIKSLYINDLNNYLDILDIDIKIVKENINNDNFLIDDGIFLISTTKCWLYFFITRYYLLNNEYQEELSINLLYLLLLKNEKNILVYNHLEHIECYGYKYDTLLMGFPIYIIKNSYDNEVFKYNFIPYWYKNNNSNFLIQNIISKNWKYDDRFNCIICNDIDKIQNINISKYLQINLE